MSTPPEPSPPQPSPPVADPGERRLARPPGERYAPDGPVGESAVGDAAAVGSPARGLAFGALAGLAGAAATVVLGGLLTVSAGLLVAAAATGWATGVATRVGGGATFRPPPRVVVAVLLAALAVTAGQLGLWLYARTEGGVLSLPDYLGQTFGVLVPLQLGIAVALAWWTAR
jgi:hypothetical protein